MKILQGGSTRFDGYLDANGCTGGFAASGGTDFAVFGYSRARIGTNDVIVRDAASQVQAFVIWDADPGANLTPTYVFPEASMSTVLAVAAFTVQRIPHGLSGKSVTLENRCQPNNGCCNCAAGGQIWLSDLDRKFIIAHELGHRLLSLDVGTYDNDVSFDLDPTDANPTCDTSTSHSMWSLEFESGAAMEGWAHFVAAVAFNTTGGANPGAVLRYWSSPDTTVDVEQGPTGGASTYADSVCPGVAISAKLSVELDWLRHWWDYYTNALASDPGVKPSWAQLTDAIAAALPWSASTTWDDLSAAIQETSGDDQAARWAQHGAWNGID